jgi:hypothetical protein
MKKILFSGMLISMSLIYGYAQSKTSLMPTFKLGYPSVILGKPDDFSLPKGVTSKMNGVFLMSIGGDLKYQMNKNMALQVGINTSVSILKQKFFGFTWGSDWDPVLGIAHKSVTIEQLNLLQINTPIVLKYGASQKMSYNLGFVPQITLSQKAQSKIAFIDNWKPALDNGTVQYPLKKFNPAIHIGMSFYRKLNSKMQMDISPYFQFNLIADDLFLYYTKNRFYQAGVSVSLEKI